MPDALQASADELRWYHTIELPNGVVTKGFVDTRAVVPRLPLPASLAGKRCLDIGTQNGFWAFELERRGAASVVGIDLDDTSELDWPPRRRLTDASVGENERAAHRQSFEFAKEALGSTVERRSISIYELDPDSVGVFDFVYLGSLLLHLRDPVQALAKVREICTGEAVFFDTVSLLGSLVFPRKPWAHLDGTRVWWWTPNRAALRRMIESAGWDVIETSPMLFVPGGEAFRDVTTRAALKGGLDSLVSMAKGSPHIAFRARPVG